MSLTNLPIAVVGVLPVWSSRWGGRQLTCAPISRSLRLSYGWEAAKSFHSRRRNLRGQGHAAKRSIARIWPRSLGKSMAAANFPKRNWQLVRVSGAVW